jgi:hypothetical protein
MRFAQGMWMGQPSRINAKVLWTEDDHETIDQDFIPDGGKPLDSDHASPRIHSVWVGGSAALTGETVLEIE